VRNSTGASPVMFAPVFWNFKESRMRTLICAAVAFAVALCAVSTVAAADKKKGKAVTGVVKKIDAEKGTITVAVKVKKETMEKEFKLGEDVKVTVIAGDDKKEMSVKDAFKADLKEGATVTVVADDDGKVSTLTIGMAKKKKTE
jgi:hypothetical protein